MRQALGPGAWEDPEGSGGEGGGRGRGIHVTPWLIHFNV